nr:MAG TPA: hypothetical protein [Caudoviricetes sp.]
MLELSRSHKLIIIPPTGDGLRAAPFFVIVPHASYLQREAHVSSSRSAYIYKEKRVYLKGEARISTYRNE